MQVHEILFGKKLELINPYAYASYAYFLLVAVVLELNYIDVQKY